MTSLKRILRVAFLPTLAVLVTLAAVRFADSADAERPGELGMLVVDLRDPYPPGFDPQRRGAMVTYLVQGGPADRAGVREGDIVVKFDNQDVTGAAELLGRIRRLGAGRLASMIVWREGKEIDTGLMTLAERGERPGEIAGTPKPPATASSSRSASADMRIAALESDIHGLERDIREMRTRIERLEAEQRRMIGR